MLLVSGKRDSRIGKLAGIFAMTTSTDWFTVLGLKCNVRVFHSLGHPHWFYSIY